MSSDQQSSCSDTVTNHPLPPSQSEGTLMMMYLVVIVCVCVFISHMQLVYKLIGSLTKAMVYRIILVIVMNE